MRVRLPHRTHVPAGPRDAPGLSGAFADGVLGASFSILDFGVWSLEFRFGSALGYPARSVARGSTEPEGVAARSWLVGRCCSQFGVAVMAPTHVQSDPFSSQA